MKVYAVETDLYEHNLQGIFSSLESAMSYVSYIMKMDFCTDMIQVFESILDNPESKAYVWIWLENGQAGSDEDMS